MRNSPAECQQIQRSPRCIVDCKECALVPSPAALLVSEGPFFDLLVMQFSLMCNDPTLRQSQNGISATSPTELAKVLKVMQACISRLAMASTDVQALCGSSAITLIMVAAKRKIPTTCLSACDRSPRSILRAEDQHPGFDTCPLCYFNPFVLRRQLECSIMPTSHFCKAQDLN